MNKTYWLLSFLFVISSLRSYSQDGNFRSRASGYWTTLGTWERDADYDGIYEDSPSDLLPSLSSDTIYVQSSHIVRIQSSTSIDQVIVQNGGRLAITAAVTVVDGPGPDLTNFGLVTTGNSNQLAISSDAEFVHARNGGSLPLATWNPGSICRIQGVTTGAPLNLNHPSGFHHFIWDCENQSTNVQLNGLLVAVNGDLSVNNTNGNSLIFTNTTEAATVVGGSFSVSENAAVVLSVAANYSIDITGSLNISSTLPTGLTFVSGTGEALLTVDGNVMVGTGATLNLSSGSGRGEMQVAGNVDLQSGSFVTETGTSSGTVSFVGTTPQEFNNAATISNSIDYEVNADATVVLTEENALFGRTLTLQGTLRVGSLNPTGAVTQGKSLGNIRTTNRNYSSTARIVFAGTGPQFIGAGHPNIAGVDLEIDNGGNGVTFDVNTSGNSGSTTLLVGGDLVLTNGSLNVISTTTTRALSLQGTVTSVAGQVNFSGSNSNLTISGSGDVGIFPIGQDNVVKIFSYNRSGNGAVTFSNGFRVRNTSTISAGRVAFSDSTTLSTVSLAAGTRLSFAGAILNLFGGFTSSGGFLYGDADSKLYLTNNLAINSPLSFEAGGNTIGSLVIEKANSGNVATVNSPLTILDNLTLLDGDLQIVSGSISLPSTATVTLSSISAITDSRPTGSSWHVVYTRGSITTGLEIPETGVVESLTLTNTPGANVFLSEAITVTNSLSVAPGINFNCVGNELAVGSLFNEGQFTAPGASVPQGMTIADVFNNAGDFYLNGGNLFVGGEFSNTGTLILDGGDIHFTGTTQLATSFVFEDLFIDGNVTCLADLNISGNLIIDGVFDGGNETVIFSGAATQSIQGEEGLAQFNDILVTNTSTPLALSIDTDASLKGTLTLSAGAVVDADGQADTTDFTILSTNLGDGGIASLPETSSIMGEVIVQRFLPAGDNTYRYISSPATAAPVLELQDDIFVTGSFTGTSYPCLPCDNNGPSLRFYQESAKGSFDKGYGAVPSTNGSNTQPLIPGRGYSAYLWDGSTDITLDIKGTLNRDTISLPVSHTPSNPAVPSADGWNLVGNPFASAIQWNGGPGWERSANIDKTVWVYDVLQGVWLSYNYDDPGNATLEDGLIASGQGFWVYASPGVASLRVNEAAKVSQTATYHRAAQGVAGLEISLSNEKATDKTFIILDENGTLSYDNGLDSYKLQLGFESMSVSILDKGEKYQYFAINESDLSDINIPLNVDVKYSGNYTLKLRSTNQQIENLFLFDRFANVYSDINESYSFSIEPAQLNNSERFYITNRRVDQYSGDEGQLHSYPNPVSDVLNVQVETENADEILVSNSLGQIVQKIKVGKTQNKAVIDFRALPSGLYYLKVSSTDGREKIQKIIKQ